MDLVTFIAESAADAVAQVRARLGPNAVVVNVRPIPASSSLWFRRRKARFEILAYRGDGSPGQGTGLPATVPPVSLDQVDSPLPATPGFDLAVAGGITPTPAGSAPGRPPMAYDPDASTVRARSGAGSWRAGGMLETSGLLPHLAQRVMDRLQQAYGSAPPESLAEELEKVRGVLAELWVAAPTALTGTHLFLGASGVGKTTCLCKWLTQKVLVEGASARVWRVDGQTANTSEALAIYCDVLGVPLERVWQPETTGEDDDWRLVDLPGTDWRNGQALSELRKQTERMAPAQMHLVLNGAYEVQLLLRQVRAFSGFPISDLIVTHLDEESRWGKLWNLVLGTNFPLRFLSAGQNIPGDFLSASPEALFRRQFRA